MNFDLREPKLIREEAYLAGKWVSGGGRSTIDVLNPFDGTRLGGVPACSVEDAKSAIAAAQVAQAGWRSLTAKERSNILRTWFNLVIQHREDLAKIITLEQGKPLPFQILFSRLRMSSNQENVSHSDQAKTLCK